MARINLVAPWDEYYNKMVAFFKDDPYVTVLYEEEDEKHIKLLVNEPFKAEALSRLLKTELDFSGVKLLVSVIPANDVSQDVISYFKRMGVSEDYDIRYMHALNDNDIYADVRKIEGLMSFGAVYVVFKKKVIQYYNDNLGDLNGMKSTLAENIARDIFVSNNGVFFCTDTRDSNEHTESHNTMLPYPC